MSSANRSLRNRRGVDYRLLSGYRKKKSKSAALPINNPEDMEEVPQLGEGGNVPNGPDGSPAVSPPLNRVGRRKGTRRGKQSPFLELPFDSPAPTKVAKKKTVVQKKKKVTSKKDGEVSGEDEMSPVTDRRTGKKKIIIKKGKKVSPSKYIHVQKAKKVRFSPNGVQRGRHGVTKKSHKIQVISSDDDSEEITYDKDYDSDSSVGSNNNVMDSSVDDSEMVKIERELLLEKKKYELLALKKQNRDMQNGMPYKGTQSDEACVYGQSDFSYRDPGQPKPNLSHLRSIDSLVQNVEEEMTSYGLFDTGTQDLQHKNVNGELNGKGKERGLKSGADEIASTSIQSRLRWPQSLLKYAHANKKYTFNTLPSFNLLVAGEMSCFLQGGLSREEIMGRMKLLRDSAYHCERFAWEAVRDFHYNVMLGIERGERSWDDSTMEIQTNTLLTANPPRSGSGVKSQQYGQSHRKSEVDRKWWCAEFQRGTCSFQGKSHEATVRGTRRWVEHFCATCMQKIKQIKYHSESSRECPFGVQNSGLSSNPAIQHNMTGYSNVALPNAAYQAQFQSQGPHRA